MTARDNPPTNYRGNYSGQNILETLPPGLAEIRRHPGLAAAVSLAQATEETRHIPVIPPEALLPASPAVLRWEKPAAGRHRHHQKWNDRGKAQALQRLAIFAILICAIAFLGLYPGTRFLIYAAWSVPVIECCLMFSGLLHFKYRFKSAPGKFTEIVIQVTTVGREPARVNEIIEQVRDFDLDLKQSIWVVTEPSGASGFIGYDELIVVPREFHPRSRHKARALEYARRVRAMKGLARSDVKILYVDDDVSLTRGYVEKAFVADYDICEGVIAPRTEYAIRPLGHLLASHADDIRTHACLVYCSIFQGIFGRPLHVHGEGLVVTGEAESEVTWDWETFTAEDLVFGQRAAQMGLSWGWFREYAESTSPWKLNDFFTQRRRWLWGDIHALTHRDVVPWWGALFVGLKYLVGISGFVLSACGLYLRTIGKIPGDSDMLILVKIGLLAWVLTFFACGWINSGSPVTGRDYDSRMLNGVLAVLFLPLSLAMVLLGIVVPLAQGKPKTFEVINKTKEAR